VPNKCALKVDLNYELINSLFFAVKFVAFYMYSEICACKIIRGKCSDKNTRKTILMIIKELLNAYLKIRNYKHSTGDLK